MVHWSQCHGNVVEYVRAVFGILVLVTQRLNVDSCTTAVEDLVGWQVRVNNK